ncbi:MAG: hypothetical protein DME97_06180 [Verrucomicrobia bacterium]|nr:MAG: hypothetical protein DME97_06180 [Verrucomicrobiota bacterium]
MSDAVETEAPGPDKKWWRLRNTKPALLLLLSVVSTTALLLSNLEGIMRFVRAHTPGGVLSQFPFTMQISSSMGAGLQPIPFYREEHIQEGTLVRPLWKADFGLPVLDFRVVNNSAEATFVRELILKVATSKPDNRPVLTWSKTLNLADGEKELTLENDGWGVALDSKIENVVATFLPKGKEKKTTAPFQLPLGNIQTKSREVSMPSLIKEQFNVERISDSDRARLSGSLTYSYVDSSGSKKPVVTPFAVNLINAASGPPPPAEGPDNADYESIQVLDHDRQDYSVPCPVSVNLEPHKAYRFVVTLCSRQSTVHDFDVILALTNGAKIKLGHYRLEFYLPRSLASAIKQLNASPTSPRFTSLDGATEDIPGIREDEPLSDDTENAFVSAKDDNPPIPAAGPGTEESPEVTEKSMESETEESPKAELSKTTKDTKPPPSSPNARDELNALKATYPYGIKVPGHADMVESPFSSGKFVDVGGFPHDSVVVDPYTKKLFLVP